MMIEKPGPNGIGKAPFTELNMSTSLWDIRQEAKQARLDGAPLVPYIVTRAEEYSAAWLNRMLEDETRVREYAFAMESDIAGETDGAYRCAALWDEKQGAGLLLHRGAKSVVCAYLPLITEETARFEHDIAMTLAKVASEAGDARIRVQPGIAKGTYRISDILYLLSEWIDV